MSQFLPWKYQVYIQYTILHHHQREIIDVEGSPGTNPTHFFRKGHRLNMELDLQSLFGLLCTAVLRLAETPQLPLPPAFGLIYEAAIGQPR